MAEYESERGPERLDWEVEWPEKDNIPENGGTEDYLGWLEYLRKVKFIEDWSK